MATATEASLFTPTLAADRVTAPWKQSLAQFSTLEPTKSVSTVANRLICTVAEDALAAATKEPEAPAGFTPPELDPNTLSPIFGGSTSSLLRKAQVEEFYVIT